MLSRVLTAFALLMLLASAALAHSAPVDGCFPVSRPYAVGARAAGGPINILASEGAPVLAPLSGRVIGLGRSRGKGLFVTVRGARETYALIHLRPRSVIVHRRELVNEGDFIAQVGHTGAVDRSVLGIELWKGLRRIDPSPVLLHWQRRQC